jgi:predicted kinase
VETTCDDATLRARLRARAAGVSVSDATEDLLDTMRREFEPVDELASREHVRVDTTRPPAAQRDAVLTSLEKETMP